MRLVPQICLFIALAMIAAVVFAPPPSLIQ